MVALGWLGTDLGRLYVNDWGPEHAATGNILIIVLILLIIIVIVCAIRAIIIHPLIFCT